MIIQLSSAIVDFYSFYDDAVDTHEPFRQDNHCRVSDTQVTDKTCGSRLCTANRAKPCLLPNYSTFINVLSFTRMDKNKNIY